MAAVFEKLGIRFMFPENWILDESEAYDGDSTVSVYSPDGAFWSVILHPPGLRPEDLIDAAVAAMRHEYEQLDAERVDAIIGGREVAGTEMNFYCLDLTNTAVVRSFATEDGTYLVFCQADDREYGEVGPVFQAITQSLLAPHAEVPVAL